MSRTGCYGDDNRGDGVPIDLKSAAGISVSLESGLLMRIGVLAGMEISQTEMGIHDQTYLYVCPDQHYLFSSLGSYCEPWD